MPANKPTTAKSPPHGAIEVEILAESPLWEAIPEAESAIKTALRAAQAHLPASTDGCEVAIVLTDDSGIQSLNRTWRGIDKPTNVLSFPTAAPPGPAGMVRPLGDIAIAFETLRREADEGNRPFAHHLAHLAIHGFLHLLGHDHEDEAEAEAMEALETQILATLDIPDPYADSDA